MRTSITSALAILALLLAGHAALAKSSTQSLTPTQAATAVGHTAIVCGTAASVHFAASSRGEPTFINLGEPYPNQVFTIVIWGEDRGQFQPPPENWEGRRVCVTGEIELYRGTPEVIVHSSDQITH